MPRSPLNLSISTAIACSIVAGGCTVVRPNARASAAHLGMQSGGAAEVDITLELSNTGSTEIELVTYDYLITLEDGSSYDGRWAALRALPPGQTIVASVPAIVPASSARVGARWTVSGTASYRDPQSFARILYEAGLLKTQASFGGTGILAEAAKPK